MISTGDTGRNPLQVVEVRGKLSSTQRAHVAELLRLSFGSNSDIRDSTSKTWWMVVAAAAGGGGRRRHPVVVAAANVERGVLWDLCVHPDCRRRGVGGALLRHVVRRAAGGARLCLFIDRWQNAPFYQKHGFEVSSVPPEAPPQGAVACMVRRNP